MGTFTGYYRIKEIHDEMKRSYALDKVDFVEFRSTKYGTHLWIAFKMKGDPQSQIDLIKIQGIKVEGGHMDFGYKPMSESCGHGYLDCPLELIDMTTGSSSEYSKQWREEVRLYHKKQKPNMKVGDLFMLWDDKVCKVLEKIKKSYRYIVLETGRTYRLPPKQFQSIKKLENSIDFILQE